VVEQIRVAAGKPLSEGIRKASQRGHAIECRLYAEDGDNNFLPCTGIVHHYSEPTGPGVRVDSGIMQGVEITIDYDPIMAKLIVHAPDRESAIQNNFKELAAAVGAVAAQSRPSAAVHTSGGGKGAIPSPWQLLGQWQIGDSIHG